MKTKRNPLAAALRSPALRPKAIRPRKGKGSYSRKGNSDVHDRVQKVYSSLDELEGYDSTYGIVARCGYKSAVKLWEDNPMLQGSTNPSDFGLSKRKGRGKVTVLSDPFYRSGLAARARGFPLSTNPHCLGTAANLRWTAQWHKENDRLAEVKYGK